MDVPLLDLKLQYSTIRDEIRAAVDQVFESQRFILGQQVLALEQEIAEYCGVPHAVGVASGTDALLLSLRALGVGSGDSVVTVPFTFFATAGAIANIGARPLFVDIDEESFNMDPEALSHLLSHECTFNIQSRKLIHTSTNSVVKAVLPVHLYGQCADMAEILETARRYSIPVIEDSCQAIGAKYREDFAGTMGDLGCLSFFPSKNLGGAGDGGMILSRRSELAHRVTLLRNHGGERRYFHATIGFNSRLDELQAAVLRVKLKHLAEWNRRRQCNAAAYDEEFKAAGLVGRVRTPTVAPDRTHIFHQYVIRVPRRDELKQFLKTRGIATEIYYPLPLHEQECFRYLGYEPAAFPRARAAAQQSLALPIFPELTEAQRSHIVDGIAQLFNQR